LEGGHLVTQKMLPGLFMFNFIHVLGKRETGSADPDQGWTKPWYGSQFNESESATKVPYSHMPLFAICKTARGFKLKPMLICQAQGINVAKKWV
jgi:hypothetical protein